MKNRNITSFKSLNVDDISHSILVKKKKKTFISTQDCLTLNLLFKEL